MKSLEDSAVINLTPAVWAESKTKCSSDPIVGKSKPLVLLNFSSMSGFFKAPSVFLLLGVFDGAYRASIAITPASAIEQAFTSIPSIKEEHNQIYAMA